MFHIVTATCPTCDNRFHVEAESPPPRREHRCACPRCNGEVRVGFDATVPHPGSTGWAVRAVPVPLAGE